MKNSKFGFIGALTIAGGLFFAGCTDPCKDINCNSGECVEGTCVCEAGYEGIDCGTAVNAKFDGTYSLTETCSASGAAGPYSVTVAPSSGSPDGAVFTGLWEESLAQVSAHISSDGLGFHIERAALGSSGFDIECTSGTISTDGTSITMTYSIYATGSSTVADQCTATLTK